MLNMSTSQYLDEQYQTALNEAAALKIPLEATIEYVRRHMAVAYDVAWHMENESRPENQRLASIH